VGGGKWKGRKSFLHTQATGFTGVRKMLSYLQNGGCIIISGDCFNNSDDCSVNFLGEEKNASLVPYRLALKAGVPLFSVTASLQNGCIEIIGGPDFSNGQLKTNLGGCVKSVVNFFEAEIRKDPSIWSPFAY